jgi:tRNA1(Val) A37 N6-methylase TrmN6
MQNLRPQKNTEQDVHAAREYFPRGLLQPPDSFRFSADALLLAAWTAAAYGTPAKPLRFLDAGTGCGVVGLALCLLLDTVQGTGFDIDPQLADAATHNAAMLGLGSRFSAVQADAQQVRAHADITPESFDLVVTNPPYRRPDQGRHAATQQRTRALFETAGPLTAFVAASAYALRNKGRFFCIYPAERLPDLLCTLRPAGLEAKSLLPVHSRAEQPARLILLEARKNANSAITIHPPLVLYAGSGHRTHLTPEALAFCPFLGCNARGVQCHTQETP